MPVERRSSKTRQTAETQVEIRLNLDGCGSATVATGLPFLDHLLQAFALHGRFDLEVESRGDLEGEAFAQALADRGGIERFGEATVPLDEARASVAVDAGGRAYAVVQLPLNGPRIGTFPASLVPHFVETFALKSGLTVHVLTEGRDDHHMAEATFKAMGRALRRACREDVVLRGRPASTKGSL